MNVIDMQTQGSYIMCPLSLRLSYWWKQKKDQMQNVSLFIASSLKICNNFKNISPEWRTDMMKCHIKCPSATPLRYNSDFWVDLQLLKLVPRNWPVAAVEPAIALSYWAKLAMCARQKDLSLSPGVPGDSRSKVGEGSRANTPWGEHLLELWKRKIYPCRKQQRVRQRRQRHWI